MANPFTCWHDVVIAAISEHLELVITCASCGTDLSSPEMREGKVYEFDRAHNLWVNIPRSRMERP